mgnify:CR=1 FL=1
MSKTVFITGSSRGIGRRTAELFYEIGYNVVINYNSSEKEALELSQKLYGSIALKGDVSSEKDVKEMIEKAVAHFGKIDVLINNAGISQTNMFTDIKEEEWNNMLQTNLKMLDVHHAIKKQQQNFQGNK